MFQQLSTSRRSRTPPVLVSSTRQHPKAVVVRVWSTPRDWCVWALTRSYVRDGGWLRVHRTQRLASKRYGAHTPLTSPIRAPDAGAMLDFQCSSCGNTTDCGETKGYNGASSTWTSATANPPSAHQVIPATEHITPLTACCRAPDRAPCSTQASSTKGVAGTS